VAREGWPAKCSMAGHHGRPPMPSGRKSRKSGACAVMALEWRVPSIFAKRRDARMASIKLSRDHEDRDHSGDGQVRIGLLRNGSICRRGMDFIAESECAHARGLKRESLCEARTLRVRLFARAQPGEAFAAGATRSEHDSHQGEAVRQCVEAVRHMLTIGANGGSSPPCVE